MTQDNRPPFKVSGNASIKHLNVRKEGPEDDQELAVDVKLEFSGVDRRLCAYFDDALEAFLWRGETDALIARNAFLAPVVYLHTIGSATASIDGRTFMGCDVKKFSLTPKDGGVMTMVCSVTLYPNSLDVAELAKHVQDDVAVVLEGPPDLFSDQPQSAAPSAARPEGDDPMYDDAVATVRKNNKASISLVQRTLRIGYNRAARLLEDMEKAGVVSAMRSTDGGRDVLQPT